MLTSRERVKRAIHFQGVDRIPHYLPDGKENDILWLWPSRVPDVQSWTTGDDGLDRRIDSWGITWERSAGDEQNIGEPRKLPIPDIAHQAEYVMPNQNAPELFEESRRAIIENNALENPKYVLGVSAYSLHQGIQNLTGMDHLFMAYYECPDQLKDLIARMAAAQRESFLRLHEIGCDGVMSYDDWGLQERLMISLDMADEFFKQHYVESWKLVHDLGMDVWMHSCGYIVEMLPRFHAWGLDVIQQDQQENQGLEKLDAAVGGKLAFWCPVDVQKTMVTGSQADVRAYVARMIKTLGNHQGGLCSKAYPQPEAVNHTPANIAAMCAAFRELGVYS